jgi:hypothetical protein
MLLRRILDALTSGPDTGEGKTQDSNLRTLDASGARSLFSPPRLGQQRRLLKYQ